MNSLIAIREPEGYLCTSCENLKKEIEELKIELENIKTVLSIYIHGYKGTKIKK